MGKEEWCRCDWPEEERRGEKYFCATCSNAIMCEICDDNDLKQATIKHIDYLICKRHEGIAIDNVASRRW